MSVRGLTRLSGLLAGGVLAFITTGPVHRAQAADLTWGGTYRIEAVKVKNSELTGDDSNKAYLLHHLVLTPKIIAADGLTIHSRFDIFNNASFGQNNQAGEVFGLGPRIGTGVGQDPSNNNNVFARAQRSGDLAVTQLYATWTQEFGQFIVGRTPLHFGLGTALNAGNGPFDHYFDTRDLLGYKIVMGNLFFLPMLGKVSEGNLGEEDDVNDYMLHVQYDNPETDLSLGFYYDLRIATAGNDAPAGTVIGGAGATVGDTYKTTLIGLYSSQKLGDFTIGVEADLLSGDTGVRSIVAPVDNVKLNSYGVAGEIKWAPKDAALTGGLKLGIASGDDPGTSDTYEGFIFSRNYDVAMLMFNHPLGQRDFFRTSLIRDTDVTTTAGKPSNQIDTEAISNAVYFAPTLQYQAKENMFWGGSLIYGILNKDPIAGSGTSSNLGFEIDVNFTYKPYERLTWVTEVGLLFPGDAWKGGSTGLDNKFAYGIVTKAAITF